MGKSRRRSIDKFGYDDFDDYKDRKLNKKRIQENVDRRKLKRFKNEIRANNLDYFMEDEDF